MIRFRYLTYLLIVFFYTTHMTGQEKVIKTNAEWKKELSYLEYHVLREKGTERANTGIYNNHYKDGIYSCKACDTKLFDSKNKYNSYSGWPAFDDTMYNTIKETKDDSNGMKRIEITCVTCNGHLGHVFNDGPKNTTGKRYCVNSISLSFQLRKK